MVLNLFLNTAIAGGPAPWDPATHATQTALPPATVHAENGPLGYTRVEITNNLTHELLVHARIEPSDDGGDAGFHVLDDQTDVLCRSQRASVPGGPDYTSCSFVMRGGEQRDVMIAFTPGNAVEDVFGKVTVDVEEAVYDVNAPAPTWYYSVEKPLIGKVPGDRN